MKYTFSFNLWLLSSARKI